MSTSRVVDITVRRSYPYPIAAAWHRVALATDDADRLRHLLGFQEVFLRTIGCLLIADYLRGPRTDRVEEPLERLSRPGLGIWAQLIREITRTYAERGDSPFFAEAGGWHFDRKGKLTDEARRLERLVAARNEEAHGTVTQSSEALAERSEELLEESRALLAGVRWLAGYRLLRVLTQEPSRAGGTQGKVQIYAGTEALPEPASVRWDARLFPGVVYAVDPRAEHLLEVSPFFQVRQDPALRQDRLLLMRQTRRGKEIALVNDETGSEVRAGIEVDDQQLPFDGWLEGREDRETWQSNGLPDDGLACAEPIDAARREVLDERFEVVEILGEGGMAQVFRAVDLWFEDEVALKVLRPELCEDEGFVERFRREARTMRNLRHPGIVPLVDTGKLEDGRLFIKMPVVEGGTLRDRVCKGGLPGREVEDLARFTLSTLVYMHGEGVVHRDIKPTNFLLDDAGQPLLSDFGIALREDDSRLTRTLEHLGSLAYSAPEFRLGREQTDRSDVFSLALVLHALATGEETTAAPGQGAGGRLGELLRDMGREDPEQRPTAAEALTRLTGETGRPGGTEPRPEPSGDVSSEPRRAGIPLGSRSLWTRSSPRR